MKDGVHHLFLISIMRIAGSDQFPFKIRKKKSLCFLAPIGGKVAR
jgi:hypothetical protein